QFVVEGHRQDGIVNHCSGAIATAVARAKQRARHRLWQYGQGRATGDAAGKQLQHSASSDRGHGGTPVKACLDSASFIEVDASVLFHYGADMFRYLASDMMNAIVRRLAASLFAAAIPL